MPEFHKLYVELYNAINEALACLTRDEQTEAVRCLVEAQVTTVGKILDCL